MENAFMKVLAASEADQKIRRAVKKQQLEPQREYDVFLSSAVSKDIITQAESQLLKDATDARWDTIQVDSYPESWFPNIDAKQDKQLNVA